MIRFSCPGCEAVFNVSDDKAGKTGKCPKCSSQFTIPAAPDAPAFAPAPTSAPAPPPVAAGGASVEIAPCPKCGARLSVEAGDIGLDVECPTCRAVYPAEPAVAVKPRNSGSGQKKPLAVREREPEAEEERPSRRRREVAREDDEEEDRPSRRGRRDEDDEEEDERPRKKKRRRSAADMESKRTTAAILAFFLGSFGAHKFYLGYTNAGLILLIGNFCTCYLFSIVSFIEFIIYLTKSDEEFIETYQIGQKEWF